MRDVSMLERVALRDHEAMDEIRKVYGETVQRIAESVLGVQRRSQVPDVVEAVWKDLWNHAHLYDVERADSAGWIRKVARECALDYFRRQPVVLSAQDATAPDVMRDKEIREELAELLSMASKQDSQPGLSGNAPVTSLCEVLRLLPPAYRGILLRRYAYWENLDRMAEVSGTTREDIANRLRLARNRLASMWPPKDQDETSNTSSPSAWEALDPDLLSDCIPDAPLFYENEPKGASGGSGTVFGKFSPASGKRRVRPLVVAAVVLVTIAAFLIGMGVSPKILKGLWTQPGGTPTGSSVTRISNVPPAGISSHFGRDASLMDMIYFEWSNISSVAVVRTSPNMFRKFRTLREPEDLDRLNSLLTSSSYVFSNSTDDPIEGLKCYELQINAEGFHSLLFYSGFDGMLLVSGNFYAEWFGPENFVVLKSIDTSFSEFAQEMDTLTTLFG